MAGEILARLGLPLISRAAAAGLRQLDSDTAQAAADALDKAAPDLDNAPADSGQLADAGAAMAELVASDNRAYRTTIAAVNRTMRAEVRSDDGYVRRMRPTFGYIMALTWAAQMGAIAYTIVVAPDRAGEVINAMAALGTVWSVGLSVLGIYVYKRSQDKAAADGQASSPSTADGLRGLARQMFFNQRQSGET